jgi:hypothetical protein
LIAVRLRSGETPLGQPARRQRSGATRFSLRERRYAKKKGRPAAALSCHETKIANYFGAGFSKIFGSTVGLISIAVILPLPLGWPAVVVVKATAG